MAISSSALLLTAAADTKSVRQTPAFITKREGDALVSGINCSHQVSSFQVILWYKQDGSRALKLLGYVYYNNPNVEEDVKGHISFDGDGRSRSSLSVAAAGLKDSGVYFCAASVHSAADSPQDSTQTAGVSPGGRNLFTLRPPWWAEELTPATLLRGGLTQPGHWRCSLSLKKEQAHALILIES